jgi:hypothetical protein
MKHIGKKDIKNLHSYQSCYWCPCERYGRKNIKDLSSYQSCCWCPYARLHAENDPGGWQGHGQEGTIGKKTLKTHVAINLAIGALMHHNIVSCDDQIRMKVRARQSLHAVPRPHNLLDLVAFRGGNGPNGEGFRANIVIYKGAMVFRVVVSGVDY